MLMMENHPVTFDILMSMDMAEWSSMQADFIGELQEDSSGSKGFSAFTRQGSARRSNVKIQGLTPRFQFECYLLHLFGGQVHLAWLLR